ncbi:MlaD family protein [Nocardioides daejeonensis]|uniref:MlaD family protein n=1 Tax=Nocardioides daejeonensis TaxID=1046556 RepID=UPI0013A58FC9|nr:MlaD family protein [Nocardioides daejeonensis]
MNASTTFGKRSVLTIAVALTVVLIASLVLIKGSNDSDGPEVAGIFADASPLEVGSEVRVYGVKVGEVSAIDLVDNKARVVLDVDDEVLPLHADAQMKIRPINLLGENFVEIVPGTGDQPTLDGDVPVEQTETIVTLQAVLDTFDDPTAAGLAALVSELGNGVSGNGDEMADVIKALAPAMYGIDDLGRVLEEQNQVLDSLIATADPVAAAVAGQDGKRIEKLVEQAHGLLATVAAERQGLEQTLTELPGAIKEARTTLAALDTVAGSVAPTLKKARPVTDDLETISKEIVEFSKYAEPAFASFDEVFKHADDLLAEAAPAVAQLKAAGPELRRGSDSIKTLGDEVLVEQPLSNLMAFVRKWALSTNSRDNVSHYFRGLFHVTPKALNLLLGSTVVPPILTPGESDDGNSDKNDVLPDLPGLDLGGLEDLLSPDNNILGGLLGHVLPGIVEGKAKDKSKKSDPKSATGLTDRQEQSLLGLLLGGGR